MHFLVSREHKINHSLKLHGSVENLGLGNRRLY
jgi:hypothetical protein